MMTEEAGQMVEKTDVAEMRKVRVPVYRAEVLFGGGRQIRIGYGEKEYRLIITRNEKLILMK